MEQGKKFDQGKVRLDLVPPEVTEAIGVILTFGANKYGDHNWRAGLNYSRVLGALKRHLLAFEKGEKLDEETGKPHLWHAACCLSFLISYEAHPEVYSEFDDLYYYEKE